MLIPSISTSPEDTSYNLSNKLTVVLLPQPDSPTKATFLPDSIRIFKLFKIILLFVSEG